MKGMLQRKQQFLQCGTLKVDQGKEFDVKLKYVEDEDNKSQDLGDDVSKVDPKEVRKQCRVINAENRRDEWIRHQQQKLAEEDHDQVFRKGIDRGKNAKLHSYRGHYQKAPGDKQKPLKNMSMPRAADRFRDKVNATADGATGIDCCFKN